MARTQAGAIRAVLAMLTMLGALAGTCVLVVRCLCLRSGGLRIDPRGEVRVAGRDHGGAPEGERQPEREDSPPHTRPQERRAAAPTP